MPGIAKVSWWSLCELNDMQPWPPPAQCVKATSRPLSRPTEGIADAVPSNAINPEQELHYIEVCPAEQRTRRLRSGSAAIYVGRRIQWALHTLG